MKTKVFITGATGFQGGSIARHLAANHYEVVSLSPNIPPGQSITPQRGITIKNGTFASEVDVLSVLDDVQQAVITFPLIFDMNLLEQYAKNIVRAARKAQLKKVLWVSSIVFPHTKTGKIALDAKLMIENILKDSGLNIVTLVPHIYADNFAAPWSLPLIEKQSILPYPIPANTSIPWLSHADLGRYVLAALQGKPLIGRVNIASFLATGEEIASELSTLLHRTITFIPIPPDNFEKQLESSFEAITAREIANIYRHIASGTVRYNASEYSTSAYQLGIQPSTLGDWCRSIGWK